MAGFDSQTAQAKTLKMQKNHQKMMLTNRNYASVSLCGCTVTNPVRELVIKIVTNPWFDRLILFFILANSVTLALDDPLNPRSWISNLDYFFLSIFSFEMVLKIIAMGFIMRPYSYLRDPWNMLDFTVVILGWTGLVLSGSNVNAIRAVRILRPLRSISAMPGMQGLVKTLINSLPQIFNVLILFSVFVLIMSIVGVQLFSGNFVNRCVLTSSIPSNPSILTNSSTLRMLNQTSIIKPNITSLNSTLPKNATNSTLNNKTQANQSQSNSINTINQTFIELTDVDGNEVFCDPINNMFCPQNYSCIYWGNPGAGIQNWDNLFFGTVMTFQIISLNNWSDQMNQVRRYYGNFYYDSYFVLTVVFGAFFVLNLLVAVQFDFLKKAFTEIDMKKSEEKKKKKKDRSADEQNLDNNSDSQFNFCCKLKRILSSKLSDVKQTRKPKTCSDFQKRLLFITDHDVFQLICLILIILNTFLMASEYYGQPLWLQQTQDKGNQIFSALFIIEGFVRFLAQGPKNYFSDGFNLFDSVVNFVSFLDYLNIGSNIVALRGFRLLRIFKVIRSSPGLKVLLQIILKSISAISNLSLLILMFVFIYALLGKSFFYQTMYDINGEVSRFQFDNMLDSMLLIFIILTMQNGAQIMQTMVYSHGYFGVAFCTSAMFIGNFMLLNLFLAILIKYTDDKNLSNHLDEKQEVTTDNNLLTIQQDQSNDQQNDGSQSEYSQEISSQSMSQSISSKSIQSCEQSVQYDQNQLQTAREQNEEIKISQDQHLKVITQNQNIDPEIPNNGEESKTTTTKKDKNQSFAINGNSLFLIAPNSKPRIWLAQILRHSYFEAVVFHIIFINAVMLAIDEPSQNNIYIQKTVNIINNFCSIFFIVEAVTKIFVMGFFCGPQTYLRDSFNVLDFMIVCTSIIDFVINYINLNVDISYLKAFRSLRALRPLKLVSKNEGMKLIVNSLLNSLSGLGNVLLISLLFYTVFGILGVQFLKGRTSICSDQTIQYKYDCIKANETWIIPSQNFENFLASSLTFFEISTLEQWPSIMFLAKDSNQNIDYARITNNRPSITLIFVVFIFITNFFILNLFISIIVNKFEEQKAKTEGVSGLSEDQKEWVKIQRYLAEVVVPVIPVEPKSKWRKFIFNLIQSQFFEGICQSVILLNTIALSMTYYGSSDSYNYSLQVMNYFFVAFFSLECIIKLFGFGYTYYFSQSSNQLDFAIVLLSMFSVDPNQSSVLNTTVFRIIRVARLLRMIKTSKNLQTLLKTLYLALTNIINVGLLFLLLIFTFAIAAMNMFGDIKQGFNGYINSQVNFNTFYLSMITLFRSSTGEDWNGIMHDCAAQVGIISYIFWVLYIIIGQMIFINVFIAVIYDEFKSVQQTNDKDVLSLKRRDISNFLNTWAQFNPNGSHYMKTENLKSFLEELPPPLGFKSQRLEGTKIMKIIYCLNIRDHEGYVYFPEVMWAIFYSVIGNNEQDLQKCVQVKQIINKMKNKYKGLDRNVTLDSICGNKFWHNEITVTKYLCGITILKNLRKMIKLKYELEGNKAEYQKKKRLRQRQITKKQEEQNDYQNQNTSLLRKITIAVTRPIRNVESKKTEAKKQIEQKKLNQAKEKKVVKKQKNPAIEVELQDASPSRRVVGAQPINKSLQQSVRGLLSIEKNQIISPNSISVGIEAINSQIKNRNHDDFTEAVNSNGSRGAIIKKQRTGVSSGSGNSNSILRNSNKKSRPRSEVGDRTEKQQIQFI